jgi:hypothetical protein
MSRSYGTYDLLNRHSSALVACELYRDIAPSNVQDFREKWLPIFNEKKHQLVAENNYSHDALKEFSLQDAHWKWPEKAEAIAKSDEYLGFAVECEGTTQGLMILHPFAFAREASQKDEPLVEVKLLSTAPWNRRNLVPSPKFKGVGELLLQAAITVSLELHNEGRIGLHALSGAENWYRDYCGMSDLGLMIR